MAKPKLVAAGTLESELAGLVTTRDNLQARQTSIAAELEQAVARRREVLIQGSDAVATSVPPTATSGPSWSERLRTRYRTSPKPSAGRCNATG